MVIWYANIYTLPYSGKQRFYAGIIDFKFPMLFSGYAEVCEWYDNQDEKLKISVCVKNKFWFDLFGYQG
ncbi:MAG: DUF4166 domain-containing protein [Candidatus Sericytochromatia bacterium]|nr:DUF4166 domain-containing protein [Candidatus Sericytochromatia bacterium]